MHRTSPTAPRLGARRLVFLTLLGALLVLALAQAVPALGAAADYTGGPQAGDYPLYVSNDHSVYALRFSAAAGTLLDATGTPVVAPGAQYYVKLRISPTATPSGGTSRGFIWNPATQQWVQERSTWSAFPTVTTGTGGAVIAGNTWWYFKFGDTTKPGATDTSTWYLLVSLKPVDGADQTTQNNATPPAVTIMDMTGQLPGTLTSAFRIHNGSATGATDARRIEATNSGGTDVWSLSRTENNQVVQGYGSDTTGDFELAVPVGMAFDAKIQNVIWPLSATSFTGPLADVDVALGAADTAPPAAPASLTATAGDGQAQLSWPAVADASTYTVYEWQAPTPINGTTNYTSQHLAVATVAATSYDATGLTNGEQYFFEVRANDAATNVGPPTVAQAVTPKAESGLSLQTSANIVKWAGTAMLSGALTDGAEAFTAGQQVRAEWSYDGSTWTLLQLLDPSATFTYSVAVQPTRKTMYRLVFEGDATHAAVTSAAVTVTPKVKLGKPVAPSSVKKGKAFTAYGDLVPKAAAGSHTVKIRCYLKHSGVWKLKKTVTTTNKNYQSYSRYSAKFALPTKGSWKLVAYAAATSKYAETTSGSEYLKVR
jgi:hypothetical protein